MTEKKIEVGDEFWMMDGDEKMSIVILAIYMIRHPEKDSWSPWVSVFRWWADEKENGGDERMPFSWLHEWMQSWKWERVNHG